MNRRTRTVPTVLKTPPNIHSLNRRSRSKTRSEPRKVIGRICVPNDQMNVQTCTHYRLPVSGSCLPPSTQLRSYSPPEREYPKPTKPPLEHTKLTVNNPLTGHSSEDSTTMVVNLKPQFLRMASRVYSVVDRSSFNIAKVKGASSGVTGTSMQLTVPEANECSIPTVNGSLSEKQASIVGRAYSCEDLSNRITFLSQVSNNEPIVRTQSINMDREIESAVPNVNIVAHEAELKVLREQLDKRSLKKEKMSQELVSAKRQEYTVKSYLNEPAHAESVSEDTFQKFKNQISELYADLESLRCAHTQALDKQADLQEEVCTLRRSRDWYSEQLKSAQCSQKKLFCENEKLQALSKELGEHNHRLTHENNCLQAKLACAQAASATAKRNLSAQLDAVRVDMIEREALFERFATERASLEKLNSERAGQVSALQSKVANLQKELEFAEERFARQGARLKDLENYISSSDLKQTELQEKLSAIERNQVIGVHEATEHLSSYSVTVESIENLRRLCSEKDETLAVVAEEKASLEFELIAARREKQTLNEYLDQLKDSLARIEESFDRTRSECESKQIQLLNLTYQRDALEKQIAEWKEQERLATELLRERPKLVSEVGWHYEASGCETHRTIDVAVQTEINPNCFQDLSGHMPYIHSKPAVVKAPDNCIVPNSLGLLNSDPSLAEYELFPTESISNATEGTDHSNFLVPAEKYEQLAPQENIPQAQVDSVTEKPHIVYQSVYNAKSEVISEPSHSVGVVCQSQLSGASEAVLSLEQSSTIYTPYDGHQCRGEFCNVCAEKSLHGISLCPLFHPLIPGSPRRDDFSTERTVISEVSSNCAPSGATWFSGFGINDVARRETGIEEMESTMQSPVERKCFTKVATHLLASPHDNRQQKPISYRNDPGESRIPETVRSPLCKVTFTESTECRNFGDSNRLEPPLTTTSNGQWSICSIKSSLGRTHLSSLNAFEPQLSSSPSEIILDDGLSKVKACNSISVEPNNAIRKLTEAAGDTSLMPGQNINNETDIHKTVNSCVIRIPDCESPQDGVSQCLTEAQRNAKLIELIDREPLFNAHIQQKEFVEPHTVSVHKSKLSSEPISQIRLENLKYAGAKASNNLIDPGVDEVHYRTMVELDVTKTKLNELQSELECLRDEAKTLRQESAALRMCQRARASAHTNELEALRSIIKVSNAI